MKIKVIILLVQFICANKIIKQSDFCFGKECTGEYNYTCTEGFCSKDRLSCQELKLWSIISSHIRNERADRALDLFLRLIQDCPSWNPKYVCLNSAICYSDVQIPHRLMNTVRIVIRKPTKCEYKG